MIFYGKTFAEKQRERKGRDYDRDMRHQRNAAIEECARVADERAKEDDALYKNETDWRMPHAFNRVIRASMDIAAAIRALKDRP